MLKYELVILIDQSMSKADIETTISWVEKMLWNSIIEKDDIWLLDLQTTIKWNTRSYFVSYCLQLEPSSLVEFKNDLTLTKWIVRFFFYKMGLNEKFLKFTEVNNAFKLTQEEKKKQDNERAFKDMDSVKNMKR